jgi:hypothetical protein
MTLLRWERRALAVGIVCLTVAAVVFAWVYRPLFPPKNDAYVGQTPEQIIQQWGQPDDEWEGSYGHPDTRAYIKGQYGESRTLRFDRPRGSLYVELHEKHGECVCFASQWCPKGMILE